MHAYARDWGMWGPHARTRGTTISLADVMGTVHDRSTTVGSFAWERYNDVNAVTGTMARHAIDSVGGLGLPGLTWNSRNAYRHDYPADDERGELKRRSAAAGDIVGLLATGVLANQWRKTGYSSFGARGPSGVAMRVGIGAMLAGGSAASARKIVQNAIDDGELGMTLATPAGVAGAILGHRLGGAGNAARTARVIGAGLSGAAAGYAAFRLGSGPLRFSQGHIGEPAPYEVPPLDGKLAPAAFARGAWNHFAEEGPLTQGATFGRAWKQRDHVRDRYTTPELAGALVGDVGALALMGTGALAVTLRTMGQSRADVLQTPLGRAATALSVPARFVGWTRRVGNGYKLLNMTADERAAALSKQAAEKGHLGLRRAERGLRLAQKLQHNYRGRAPELLYLATTGIVGLTLYDAYRSGRWSKSGIPDGPTTAALAAAGMTGAAGLLTWKSSALQALPLKLRVPTAALTAAALYAGVAMVRGSVEQLATDANELHRRRPVEQAGIASGLTVGGGVGGALVGIRAARGLHYLGTGPVVGAVAGTVAGSALAYGFAPLVAGG